MIAGLQIRQRNIFSEPDAGAELHTQTSHHLDLRKRYFDRFTKGDDAVSRQAAGQFLELEEGEVRFDAGRVAIHEQADRTGRGDDGHLGVAEPTLLAQVEHAVAFVLRRRQQVVGTIA